MSCSSSKSFNNKAGEVHSPFAIQRGVNISHWLSQTKIKGEERSAFMTEQDFKLIASLGYDHVRFPIDEVHLWDSLGNRDEDGFKLLHQGINWAKKYRLKVIADLHVVRSHYFNASYNPLWDEPKERLKFTGLWEQLSAELKQYSNDFLAYEILNEAAAKDPEDWNELIAQTMIVIRKLESNRKVVIGSNSGQSVTTFHLLKIPENDKNIILSFHFYSPHVFTHYKAPWSKHVGFYKGPVHYPGKTIQPQDLKGYDSSQIKRLLKDDGLYDRNFLLARIQEPLQYAKKRGLQLYCGEFGCYPTTPLEQRLQWYADVRYVFESNNISWANWDYKGGFGVVNPITMAVQTALIDALMDKK